MNRRRSLFNTYTSALPPLRLLLQPIGKVNPGLFHKKDWKTTKSATDLLKQKNEEFMAQKRAIMKQKKLDAVKALDEKIKQQALKKAANGQSNPGNDKLIISGGPPSGSPSIFAKLGAGRGPRPGPNTPEAAKLKAARILQAQRQPKNPKTEKEKILERVKQNRMTKEEKKVEENKESEFMGKKMSKTDAKGNFKSPYSNVFFPLPTKKPTPNATEKSTQNQLKMLEF